MGHDPTFTFQATDYVLLSTPRSKYAHSVVTTSQGSPIGPPACGKKLHKTETEEPGTKKLPCPKCLNRLKFEAKWLKAYIDAYEHMNIPDLDEQLP